MEAEDEKEAIVKCVSYFKDLDEDSIAGYLDDYLKEGWQVNDFWDKMDIKFTNSDGTVEYALLWLKESSIDLHAL